MAGEVNSSGGRLPARDEAALFLAALPQDVEPPTLDKLVERMHGTPGNPIADGPVRPETAAIPLGINVAIALRAAMATRPS